MMDAGPTSTSTAKPGFLRRLSSKVTPNQSPSTLSPPDSSSSSLTGSLKSSLSEVTHGGVDSPSHPDTKSRTQKVVEASKSPGKDDKTIKPPDLLDLPENPVSRWYLHSRAFALRNLANLGFNLQNRADPPAPSPTSVVYIDSTLSQWTGTKKIQIDIWQPSTPPSSSTGRPGVVVFHGGGFILGNGTDDSRWAGACNEHFQAVVFAVNYRMAPGYPFPTPIEDCADGIIHIAKVAKEYGVDPDKLFISGFSAGGNLAFASFFLLHSAQTWGYKVTSPRVRGIVAYYPLLDFTISRKDKKEASAKPEYCLPDSMTGLFDQSYLHPPPDRSDPRVSPAKAPDEMMRLLPPVHLCICEYDMLFAEGRAFAQRLESLGIPVRVRELEKEKHGWDKPPPMTPKKSVLEEYIHAVDSMKIWLGEAKEDVKAQTEAEERGLEDAINREEDSKVDGLGEKVVDGLDNMALGKHRDAPRR